MVYFMNLIEICHFHRKPPIGDQCVSCVVLWVLLMYTCQMSIRQTLQCHVLDCNSHTTYIIRVGLIYSCLVVSVVLYFFSCIDCSHVWCFWCMRYRKWCKQFDFQSLNESKSLEHHRGHIEYGLFVYFCAPNVCMTLIFYSRYHFPLKFIW